MRDAKITQIYEGTNQIQRLVIARGDGRRSSARSCSRALAREAPPDAFGRTAREYELGSARLAGRVARPGDRRAGARAGCEVLDLGAGTGKLTRELVPRFARVVAVEPDDAMRAVLEEVVPAAEALAAAARRSRSPDGSVDASLLGRGVPLVRRRRVGRRDRARVASARGTRDLLEHPGRVRRPWRGGRGRDRRSLRAWGVPGLPRVLSGEWREPIEDGPFEELREAEVERDMLNDARRVDRQPALGQLDRASVRRGPGRVRLPPARARARRPRGAPPDPHGRVTGRAVSELAFSFGRIAAEYDDVRPGTRPRPSTERRKCSASGPTHASSTWPPVRES